MQQLQHMSMLMQQNQHMSVIMQQYQHMPVNMQQYHKYMSMIVQQHQHMSSDSATILTHVDDNAPTPTHVQCLCNKSTHVHAGAIRTSNSQTAQPGLWPKACWQYGHIYFPVELNYPPPPYPPPRGLGPQTTGVRTRRRAFWRHVLALWGLLSSLLCCCWLLFCFKMASNVQNEHLA